MTDSLRQGDGFLLKTWKILFGGHESTGMTRLMALLAVYVLVGGLVFAFLTR